MAALLECHFFPGWLQVLALWLSSGPNFEEVASWYRGWKKLFPEELQRQPRIRAQLNYALRLMSWHATMVISGRAGDSVPPSPPPLVFPSLVERENPSAPLASSQRSASLPHHAEEPSMKEVLARFAEDHGIIFMPKQRRHGAVLAAPHGKAIYTFGSIPVIADKDLICVQTDSGWIPISFDNLLQKALSE